MRVFDLQRIEGPLHAADAARKCLTPLLQLELRAKPAVAIAVTDCQHVRVQIGLWISVDRILSGLHSRQRHGETNHRLRRSIGCCAGEIRVEGADDLAANFLTDEEGFARNDVAFVVAPGLNLQLDAGL